jgi:hypothetical protein
MRKVGTGEYSPSNSGAWMGGSCSHWLRWEWFQQGIGTPERQG